MTAQGFDPYSLMVLMGSLTLLPFLLVVTTSFLKISLVLMVVRNAMGIQQVPPNMVIYGISLVITLFVMAPTFNTVSTTLEQLQLGENQIQEIRQHFSEIASPFKNFMSAQVKPDIQTMIMDTARQLWPPELYQGTSTSDFIVLIPSFVISELQTGLQVGFLIYIPFIVIDLIVSNVLLALGMQMVSPMTISLPLKILLFVVVEGWGKLLQSLALSYV